MHYEILVEGQTELTVLSTIMSQILGPYGKHNTWSIHKHRGIGKLPENLAERPPVGAQGLLSVLPAKLRAYGREQDDNLVVVVLVDLDARPDCRIFKQSLVQVLDYCPQKPRCLFRIAIEEMEAWFLGDRAALLLAYPDADRRVLQQYQQDSQCGTWEILVRAVMHEDHLPQHRSPKMMELKRRIAANISRYMDVEKNLSPSFQCFRDGLRRMQSN